MGRLTSLRKVLLLCCLIAGSSEILALWAYAGARAGGSTAKCRKKKQCYDRCYIGLLLEIHFDPWLPQTRAPVYGEGGVIQGFVMQIANAVE